MLSRKCRLSASARQQSTLPLLARKPNKKHQKVFKEEKITTSQVVVKNEKFRFDLASDEVSTIDKDVSSVEEKRETINMDEFRVNPRENKSFIERDMSMLGLSRNNHNVEGLDDCKILAFCLAYFGPKKNDETEKSKDIVKSKLSMVNSFDHRLKVDIFLEERFRSW